MKKTRYLHLLSSLLLLPITGALADVTVPPYFGAHAVLEKSAKTPVWGKADPGEEVTVTLGGQSGKATADAQGRWQVDLNLANEKAGPFELVIQGKNRLAFEDVLVGEVWIASGQSNMEWVVQNTADSQTVIANSANPNIRQFKVKKATSQKPADVYEGAWTVASPETTGGFSAVGYFFARDLQKELNTPIAIINTSWGGTPSEAWTSKEALDSVPDLKAARERIWKANDEYPAVKEAFVKSFGEWLKATGREDKPVADAAVFAGADAATEGWTKITLPGTLKAEGLPEAGAVWVRKEFDVPAAAAGKPLNLELGAIDAFDSVYWNGKLLRQTTYENYPGTGFARRYGPYTIPADQVKEGKSVLAIRIFEPVAPAKFPAALRAGSIDLSGEWLAKAEFELPAIPADKLSEVPKVMANLIGDHNSPAYLFNAMVKPLLPLAVSGVIWYQGESNAGRSWQYRTAFPLMIKDWREQLGQGDVPFYFCQLANFLPKKSEYEESGWAELRDAQTSTLSLPKTGQAILIDIGESGDIHPRNKKDVGERLSKIALAQDYGKKVPFSGPVYDKVDFKDGKAVVSFSHVEGGLVAKPVPAKYDVKTLSNETADLVRNSPNSELEGFVICGEDKKWVWADAKIEGDKVVVWSDKVPAPVAVRYAWANNPTCNLYNAAGLPAGPFRTDDFPAVTANNKL